MVIWVIGVGDGGTAAAVRCYRVGACVVQGEGCTHRSMFNCRSACGSGRVDAEGVLSSSSVVVFVIMFIQSGRCDGEKCVDVYDKAERRRVTGGERREL